MSSPAQAEGALAGIAQRQFATARKGYDPHEVRAYLAELSRLVEQLQRSEAEQRARAEEAEALTGVESGELDEKRLIELLGEETARVLEVARAAATEIRRKAEESAARLISEASDQAQRLRTDAEDSASRALGEATDEAHRLRSEAQASAERLVGEATDEAERLRTEAEESAARTRREVTDEVNRFRAEAEAAIAAQRIELRTEVESMRREAATELDRRRAEGEALAAEMRREAEEECATLRAAAQEEGRKMVTEAQVVRERMLRDLGRRRRSAREQLERLNAARERLLAAYEVVRRTVDAATGELTVALPEAKVAGEAAMRRAQGEPEPSVEELDDLVAMARIAGLLDPRLEPSILDDDDPAEPAAGPGSDADPDPAEPPPTAERDSRGPGATGTSSAERDSGRPGHPGASSADELPAPATLAADGLDRAEVRTPDEPGPAWPPEPRRRAGHVTPAQRAQPPLPPPPPSPRDADDALSARHAEPLPSESGSGAGVGASGQFAEPSPPEQGASSGGPRWSQPGPRLDRLAPNAPMAEGHGEPAAPWPASRRRVAATGAPAGRQGVEGDVDAPAAGPDRADLVGQMEVVAVDVSEVAQADAVAALREIAELDEMGVDDDADTRVEGYEAEPALGPGPWPGAARPPVPVIDVASAEGPEELDGEELDEDPIPVDVGQLALTSDEAEVVAHPDDAFGSADAHAGDEALADGRNAAARAKAGGADARAWGGDAAEDADIRAGDVGAEVLAGGRDAVDAAHADGSYADVFAEEAAVASDADAHADDVEAGMAADAADTHAIGSSHAHATRSADGDALAGDVHAQVLDDAVAAAADLTGTRADAIDPASADSWDDAYAEALADSDDEAYAEVLAEGGSGDDAYADLADGGDSDADELFVGLSDESEDAELRSSSGSSDPRRELAGRRRVRSGSEGSMVDELFAQLRAGRETEQSHDAALAESDPTAGPNPGDSGSGDLRRHGALPHLLEVPDRADQPAPSGVAARGGGDAGLRPGDPDPDLGHGRAGGRTEPDREADVHPERYADSDSEPYADPDLDLDQGVLRRRDETLIKIEQGLARRLKRVLADEQNEVLDLLRRTKEAEVDELLPDAAAHQAQYGAAARDDLGRAAEAGAQEVADAASFAGSCDELAADLGRAVVAPLRERIARSLVESGTDPDELTNRLRALYREWKAQRINDAVHHFAAAAYARGAYASVPEGTALVWVVDRSGDLCPDADDNALAGPVRRGEPFPTGDRCPPAHLGCRCLVVPAGDPSERPVAVSGARGVGLADTGRT